MGLMDDIKYNFIHSNVSIKRIIIVNVAVFLLITLPSVVFFLLNLDTDLLNQAMRWFKLPAAFSNLIVQPWSLVTYMFLHSGFFHLLFNMLWLYWIGMILHEYLGNRKVYEAYVGGGISGGIIFVLSFNIFPVFAQQLQSSFAIGASAGVLAVVVATATLLPEYAIQLLFFGNVRLKYIALITIVLDLISIPQGNAGGHIAHLGGALFGFFYIKYIYKYGNLLPDRVYNWFKPKSKIKLYHRSGSTTAFSKHEPSQEQIDRILDKISKSGYDSLSKSEKEILFKASKE